MDSKLVIDGGRRAVRGTSDTFSHASSDDHEVPVTVTDAVQATASTWASVGGGGCGGGGGMESGIYQQEIRAADTVC